MIFTMSVSYSHGSFHITQESCLILKYINKKILNCMEHLKNADSNVKVVCRFRPLNAKEKEIGVQTIHQVIDRQTVKIKDPKIQSPLIFNLDCFFDLNSTQQQVYEISARPVVQSVLEGFNGTIFAYGQTSSGKTHTMQGYNLQNHSNKGIVPRMIQQVFTTIAKSPQNIEFRLKVSIVQLYMQKVRDLLDISKQDLKIRSHAKKGIYIEDVTQQYVSDENELYALMQIGNKNRASCSTNMNERSSRSHMIFLITIYQSNLIDMSAKSGKLFLVDLAGSQKISKTGAQGKVLDEAKKINLSLTSLGKVIKALTEGKNAQHIPYRQSKLTRILQQSLGGNAKTTLIITCSPHPTNLQQTISTLRFGISAKKITNKAKINRQLTVGELQVLLQKSEKELKAKNEIIAILQSYIKNDLRKDLPNYILMNSNTESQNTSAITQINLSSIEMQSEDKQSQRNQKTFDKQDTIISELNKEIDERIKILQMELQSEKSNMLLQTEKLNKLRMEFSVLHTNCIELETNNNNLKTQNKLLAERVKTLEQKVKNSEDVNLFIGQQQRNIIKLVFNEIMNTVSIVDIRQSMIEKLNKKKWFQELETEKINVNSFFQEEKEKLMTDLQNKIESLNKIEKQLEEQTLKNKIQLEKSTIETNSTENQNTEKLIALEKDLQELYVAYYDMISLQSTWKAQCQIYERKLNKKCKQVNDLEEMVIQLKKQIENYRKRQQSDNISVIKVGGTKLIKPIRGGSKYFEYK